MKTCVIYLIVWKVGSHTSEARLELHGGEESLVVLMKPQDHYTSFLPLDAGRSHFI